MSTNRPMKGESRTVSPWSTPGQPSHHYDLQSSRNVSFLGSEKIQPVYYAKNLAPQYLHSCLFIDTSEVYTHATSYLEHLSTTCIYKLTEEPQNCGVPCEVHIWHWPLGLIVLKWQCCHLCHRDKIRLPSLQPAPVCCACPANYTLGLHVAKKKEMAYSLSGWLS